MVFEDRFVIEERKYNLETKRFEIGGGEAHKDLATVVHEAVLDVLDFWLEKGVDGLRLDAVTYLYEREGTTCDNLPETHEFLKKLRAHVDARYDDRMLLAEANQWPEDAVAYFGDPEKGAPGQALSVMQGRKLKEITAKAKGEAPRRRWGRKPGPEA